MGVADVQRLLRAGMQFARAGRPDQAEIAFRAAVEAGPGDAGAWGHWSGLLRQRGRLEEALAAAERGLTSAPADAALHFLRGNILEDMGRYAEAAQAYERAVQLAPGSVNGYVALGVARMRSGDEAGSGEAWQRALGIVPNNAVLHSNFSGWLTRNGRAEEAAAHGRRAVELNPRLAGAWGNLGNALVRLGRMDEAIEAYRRGWELDKTDRRILSGLVFSLHYRSTDALALRSPHVAWGEAMGPPDRTPFGNTRDPDRKLRIGYLSPDFRSHAINYFLVPLLARHDRAAFEIYCYAELAREDAVSAEFRAAADGWRLTAGQPAAQVAQEIRADGIDVLVDLAVHTSDNRLDVMARRAAPVQASYLGYPSTTGLAAVDYVILDKELALEGQAEALCVEKIWRLEGSYFCFRPPGEGGEVGDLPAQRNGFVTFGAFNNFAKISPGALALWGRAMMAVAGSKIILKGQAFRDVAARKYVEAGLGQAGVAGERIILREASGMGEYLAELGGVDIALDAFPYNGGTTTCQALWMGVPVVTLVGNLPVGRMGLSILTHIGLEDLAAATPEAFVRTCAELAGDWERLAGLRAGMRQRMKGSGLMDEAGATRGIESAYRGMWRQWCARE